LPRIRRTNRGKREQQRLLMKKLAEYHKRRFGPIQTGAHQETSSNTLFHRNKREDLYQVLYILSRSRRHRIRIHNFSQTSSSWFLLFSAFNHQKSILMHPLICLSSRARTLSKRHVCGVGFGGLKFIPTNQHFACRVCGKLNAPLVLKTNGI